jgi:hypothetical protein
LKLKIKCSVCGEEKEVEIFEINNYKTCKLCNGRYTLNEDLDRAVKKVNSINIDRHLEEAINTLGLEQVLILVEEFPHLKIK